MRAVFATALIGFALCGLAGCGPLPYDPNPADAAAEMNMGAALLRAGQPSALPYGAYQLPSSGAHCSYGGGYLTCW